MISAAIITTVTDAQSVAGQWESLTAGGASSIYTSSSWCLAAWRHLPDLGSPLLMGAVNDGRLIGLMPLTTGVRGLSWAGSPLGDEHDILIDRADLGEAVAGVLIDAVHEQLHAATTAELLHVRPDGVLAHAITGIPGCPAPIVSLHRPDQVFHELACLPGWPRKRRRDLRRCRAQLRELGTLTYLRETDPTRLAAALPLFVTMRLRAWAQRGRLHELPDMDRHPQFPAFISDACHDLAAQEKCFLAMLLLDGEPVAQALFFRTPTALLLYMSTYEPRVARYSPSNQLLAQVAAEAVTEGTSTIELGRGDEGYKFDLGAEPRHLCDIVLHA